MFPAGSEGLHLVVDEHGKFKEKNFQRAVSKLATTTLEGQMMDAMAQKKQRRQQKQTVGSDLQRIVKMIMDKNYDPVIVFSFSKRDCETCVWRRCCVPCVPCVRACVPRVRCVRAAGRVCGRACVRVCVCARMRVCV
jgi:hypothetical protein